MRRQDRPRKTRETIFFYLWENANKINYLLMILVVYINNKIKI